MGGMNFIKCPSHCLVQSSVQQRPFPPAPQILYTLPFLLFSLPTSLLSVYSLKPRGQFRLELSSLYLRVVARSPLLIGPVPLAAPLLGSSLPRTPPTQSRAQASAQGPFLSEGGAALSPGRLHLVSLLHSCRLSLPFFPSRTKTFIPSRIFWALHVKVMSDAVFPRTTSTQPSVSVEGREEGREGGTTGGTQDTETSAPKC